MADDNAIMIQAIAAKQANDAFGLRSALKQAIRKRDHESVNLIITSCYPNGSLPIDMTTERLLRMACAKATPEIVYDMTLFMPSWDENDDKIANARARLAIFNNLIDWLKGRNRAGAEEAIADAIKDCLVDLRGNISTPSPPPPSPPVLEPTEKRKETRSGRAIQKPMRYRPY